MLPARMTANEIASVESCEHPVFSPMSSFGVDRRGDTYPPMN